MKADQLFENTKGRLFSYLVRATGDYSLSEDILQETFTRFMARYDGNDNAPSLLFTIARNALIDHRRKTRRTTALAREVEDDSCDTATRFLIKEQYARVLDAIQRLPEDDRDVLSLVVSGDLTYAEIARVLGMSEAGVKVRVHRARCRLREIIKGGQDERRVDKPVHR